MEQDREAMGVVVAAVVVRILAISRMLALSGAPRLQH